MQGSGSGVDFTRGDGGDVRTIQIQVPSDGVDRVVALAVEHGARAPADVTIHRREYGHEDGSAEWSLVFASVPNDRVGPFIAAVTAEAEQATFVLLPVGSLPLAAPLDRMDERVRDVSPLSTLELVAGSLQSVGAWRGLLSFSVLAGLVAAYGLIFETAYLLVAAMLINPMGAPALVSVIGVAIGDGRMVARGGGRFAVSLAVQAATALGLGVAYRLQVPTPLMEQVASLSVWAVALALAAGAAGAQAQVKSERDSLVSGTAAGFMVAAALAPPAAVLGLSVPLGRWDFLVLMSFLLVLQYLAIALGGWLILHAFGVRPGDPTIGRGSSRARTGLVAGLVAGTIALVAWQGHNEPRLVRADVARDAVEIVRDAVAATEGAAYIHSTARFTRMDLGRHAGETILLDVTVEMIAEEPGDLEGAVRREIGKRLSEGVIGVVPFIRVTILSPADAP